MYLKQKILYILLCLQFPVAAQQIHGFVYGVENGKRLPLPGITIYWQNHKANAVMSDSTGHFQLDKPATFPATVIFQQFLISDSLIVSDPALEISKELNLSIQFREVRIRESRDATTISRIDPIKTEMISSRELKKAACCNLSESFDTNPTVDVSFSDAVSGAKQIQMLGLSGKYTQLLTDNLPLARGLSANYNLSYIPGTYVNSIQVAKGAGSVVNGYESMTGQINIDQKSPETSEKLLLNIYTNHFGRMEANINKSNKVSSRWSTLTMVHADYTKNRMDLNKDGFLDMPFQEQYNALHRWNYMGTKGGEAQFGVKALTEKRFGGQVSFNPENDLGSSSVYGVGVKVNRMEAFAKAGYVFPKKDYKSFGSQFAVTYHDQQSNFGINKYLGLERSFYSNLIYETIIGTTEHKIKSGFSFLYDEYDENYNKVEFDRTEIVPGIFTEYSWTNLEKFALVAGLRSDFHNLYGTQITPRIHFKWNIDSAGSLRLSAGSGFRTANVFAENTPLMASSRQLMFLEKLQPEKSWNFGINYTRNFTYKDRSAYWTVDLYRTEFENQVILDLDQDPQKIIIQNLHGSSFSNVIQLEFGFDPLKNLEFKAAYKLNDVRQYTAGKLREKTLVPSHKLFSNIAYSYKKWKLDYTVEWTGKQRLPFTSSNPVQYRRGEFSKSYTMMYSQISRTIKKWEFYLGAENLLNFRQSDPILAANEPFGKYFDSSFIWGPITGRMVYTGLRYQIR